MKQFLHRRIALTFIGIGFVLIALGFTLGGREYVAYANLNDFSSKGKQTVKKIELVKEPLSTFQNLEVNLDLANFSIEPSTDNQAYLSYRSTNRDVASPLNYEEKDNTLILEKTHSRNYFIDISFFNHLFNPDNIARSNQISVTLYLPEKMLETVTMNIEAGSATIRNLQAKQATLSSQKLTLSDSNINSLQVLNEIDHSIFNNTQIEELTMRSESGNLTFEETTVQKGDIHTEFGTITLTDSAFKNTKFQTESGNIKGEQLTFTGENNLKSDYGDITLGLTKKTLQDTQFFLQTESGKVTVPNLNGKQTNTSFVSTQSAKTIVNATIESGNITIK